MTRDELAAKACISPRTIAAIEREGSQPRRATRFMLALALGVRPDEL